MLLNNYASLNVFPVQLNVCECVCVCCTSKVNNVTGWCTCKGKMWMERDFLMDFRLCFY